MTTSSSNLQPFLVQIEIEPENVRDVDPTELDDLGNQLVTDLRQQGYTLKPAYTGQRGGTVFDMVLELAQHAWENKDLLLVLFGAAKPAAEYLLKERDRRAEKAKAQADSQVVEVAIEIDGAALTIRGKDITNMMKQVEEFKAAHPQVAAKVTPKSTVKVKGKVGSRK